MHRRDPTARLLLDPHNEHIVLLPVAIQELALRIFGSGPRFRHHRAHPEDPQRQLLDRDREQDDVLVVRVEQSRGRRVAPVHQELP